MHKAGDPWAMHLMVPSYNGYCAYLSWPCNESWMEKSIIGWKKLAAQGDGKAMYALMRWGDKPWWSYVPILKEKRYGELAEKAVKAGGYEAAGYNAHLPLDIKKRVELLQYAASQNYAPAMIYLYDIKCEHPELNFGGGCLDLLKQTLNLGYDASRLSSYYEHFSIKLC